ncbi:ATP-dependent DNA helicase [Gloeophyllum trabeum ATCC 11539]|uniref:ATP-dependent DNA helicase n=1 Tax=Gloeophyllum trabeum (strain ATCC 11539 / FP-39264 / Madison 617) TaxID=670483 RepID=S7Q2H7_GLOTA|nr:ATP-dependent DNA helicase [Gloeophyllum trabeum ATCC 11539]EPQ53743.1 ATP-dependent DNA helicase [Gloeophyllum trabeum ATCC 11539]
MSDNVSLQSQINSLDIEIRDAEENIKKYQDLRDSLVSQKQAYIQQLHQRRVSRTNTSLPGKGGIDYMSANFEWTHELKTRMAKIFGIENFRLCQQGVCNANMDGRDIVCVMPTGGGKSLTYQLPALLTPGCTLVISPLISLIQDQIMHLQEVGVEAAMVTGAVSKQETDRIYARLTSATSSSADGRQYKEIKLLYVTPEKISKSKLFKSKLNKLYEAGRLARIVIDEAHCVSQLGHDFRPDYQQLAILRQLFPSVPILALSATCPPKVLEDLLKTLRMKAVVDGRCAPPEGTIYFTSSLYRKNLHYKVVAKPSSAQAVIKAMADYILSKHLKESGIIYCLSQKDSMTVAKDLYEASGYKIKTGVYHAGIPDADKETLHRRWRNGEIQVVCATIAFGLGIDKGDVRFVLHHSMSKSVEGFYQESGRAGRDGKDSDCVLYYRPQDASRLSGIACEEKEGPSKLFDMLRFVHDLKQCRKIQFANYFSMSSHVSLSSWATEGEDALKRCGHCDNCLRDPQNVESKDVTLEAWQILRVAEEIKKGRGLETLAKLSDFVRGAGGGGFQVKGAGSKRKGKGKATEKTGLDIEDIAGGKVNLSKENTERLLVELLLSKDLQQEYKINAYATNVYNKSGRKSNAGKKANTSAIKVADKPPRTSNSKRKKAVPSSDCETDEDEEEDLLHSPNVLDSPSSDPVILDSETEDSWAFSFRESQPPRKKPRRSNVSASSSAKKAPDSDDDVICLLSD